MRLSACVLGIVCLVASVRADSWQHVGKVADGNQFNATIGADGNIHIITDRYIRLSLSGEVLETVDSVSDGRMGDLDFWPAIAAGADGTIHIVTRHGGSWGGGHTLRYRRRSADGIWSAPIQMASALPRNYIVACAVTSNGVAWAVHGVATGDNVSRPRFYKIESNTVTYLGNFSSQQYHRSDVAIRFIADGNALVMASAYHWTGHPVSLFRANGSNTLHSDLESSRWTATTGDSRVSFPAIHVHEDGTIDLAYGAVTANEVYFCRYNSDATSVSTNVLALPDMNKWHCGHGCTASGLPPLSVVASSADKQNVMVVGIVGDETEYLVNGPLVYALSTNGGADFGTRTNVGKNTHAGDGRRLPILLARDNTFYMIYHDRAVGGISLSTFSLVPSTDPAIGLTPSFLTFSASADDASDPASQSVTISNVGASGTSLPSTLTASSNRGWLNVSVVGGNGSITNTVSRSSAMPGIDTATVTVSGSGVASATYRVRFEYTAAALEVGPLVKRINAGGGTVSGWDSQDGHVNTGTRDFSTTASISVAGVANAGPSALYQTCRHYSSDGTTGPVFTFPSSIVPNGDYVVRLHFAEPQSPLSTPRQMTVSIEGTTVLTGFNPATAAGSVQKAYVWEGAVTVSEGDGMTISLTKAGGNDAFVSGIEVYAAPGTVALPAMRSIGVERSTGVHRAPSGEYRIVVSGAGEHAYQVFSMKGSVVASGRGHGSRTYPLDASVLPAGVYVARIVTSAETIGNAFVVSGER